MSTRFSSSQSGFAIRSKADPVSFYEINGIGDWSVSASADEASIFLAEWEARDAMEEEGLTDDKYEIVPISRTVQVEISE